MLAMFKRVAAAILFCAIGTPAFAQSGTNEGWRASASSGPTYQSTPAAACQYIFDNSPGIQTLEEVVVWPPLTDPDWCKYASYKCKGHYPNGAAETQQTGLFCPTGKEKCFEKCVKQGTCTCDPPTCKNGSPSTQNPIVLTSGEQVEHGTDYASGGAYPLRIDRTYRSLGGSGEQFGLLGLRWRLPWDAWLMVVTADQSFRVDLPNDARFSMVKDANGVFKSNNAPSWDVKATHITSAPEAYEITGESDEVYRFELVASNWRLKQIRQRSGYVQTLNYDAAGLLLTVTDNLSRTLTFTYEPAQPAPYQNREPSASHWTP